MNDKIHSIFQQSQLAYLMLKNALASYQKTPDKLASTELAAVEKQARLQYDIEEKVLSSKQAQQITVEPSQVDRALEAIQQDYSDQDSFVQELARHGMTLENFRVALARELQTEAILDSIGASVCELINEVDAEIYYYLHRNKFQQPEKRTVRHILITINDDLAENTREVAKNRLTEIAHRLQHNPQLFIEQAKKFSECPSALEGGLIGSIPHGKLYPQLDEVLFAMAENQISQITESPMGFHLLLCEKIIPGRLIPYAEVQDRLLTQLKTRYRSLSQKRWLSQLSSEYNR
jgi:peptidyl-prolyl cis-trans isomerase C